MNVRQLKLLTRQLIEACGGLDEAASACRYSAAQLSRCQNAEAPDFLALDVVAKLEAYCGASIVSRALAQEHAETPVAANLMQEACEASEAATDFQREVRLVTADGVITNRERDKLRQAAGEARRQLAEAEAAIDAA